MKPVEFFMYRYQLLPTTTQIQARVDGLYTSYDDLVSKKNSLLADILTSKSLKFRGKGYPVISRLTYNDNNSFLFKFGVKKETVLSDEEFNKKTEPNYPNSYIGIDNNDDAQVIFIENNNEAFSHPVAVSKIIEKTLSDRLRQYQLAIYIEPIYSESEFWETLERYQGKITRLKFEFIRPNMANISSKAVEAIKVLKANTNSHKTDLTMNAPEGGTLENLNRNNTEIGALGGYCADGGGTPKVKVKNFRKMINTNKNEVKVTFEEAEFTGMTEEGIIKALKALGNDKR